MAEGLREFSTPRRRAASMATGLCALKQQPAGADDLMAWQLEAVRETLLAKACLGLLHWWLMALLDLAYRAEAAAAFWREQMRCPLAHEVWLGPRHWRGAIRSAAVATLSRFAAGRAPMVAPMLLLPGADEDGAAPRPRARLQRLGGLVTRRPPCLRTAPHLPAWTI
jgi:hypothetical protein